MSRVQVRERGPCLQERWRMWPVASSLAASATRVSPSIHLCHLTPAKPSSQTAWAVFNKLQVLSKYHEESKIKALNWEKKNAVTSSFFPGLYCSGWLKTGPTGVIATTMNNSFDTARSLLDDMDSGTLDVSPAKPGSQSISGLLEKRGTLLSLVVSSHSVEPRYLTWEHTTQDIPSN